MNSLNINRCASSKGSINRHMINGVAAYDYFSPKQIINELKSNTRLYFNNDLNILKQANDILKLKTSDSKVVEEIIYKFGLRLAEILYIFENPSIEQMNHRKDYSKEDWDYLKSIKRIYIAGGLLTKEFSLIFEKALEDYFSKNCFNKEVIFITESSNLALEGLTKVITNNSLVYDFGQTNVKNGVYRNKELIIKDPITVSISKQEDLKLYASNCNNFILDVLLNQLKSNPDITEINMAISNYVNNGVIDPAPWYYGVLYYFRPDYEEFLREKLSEILKKEIKVKLYHDTTAMGYSIKEKENAMLISLGTAFGVCYFD
jgi:hypothetical protein